MNLDLFDKIEMLEQTPTALLTEITPTGNLTESDLNSLTDHTNNNGANYGSTTPQTGQNPPLGGIPGNQSTGQQTLNAGNMVTPELAVQFFNILIPAAICLLINKATDKKVVKSQFEATNKELAIIEPVLQKYLNSINFNVDSPFTALVITVGFIYGSKTIEALNGKAMGTIKTTDFKPPVAAETVYKSATTRKPRPSGMKYDKKVKF